MREILVIVVAILLVGAVSSAQECALDYYIDKGITFNYDEKYLDADEAFHTAEWLKNNDFGDAPIMTEIDPSCPEYVSNNISYYWQEKSVGCPLSFALTNCNDAMMTVSPFYINVLNYSAERLSDDTRRDIGRVPRREYSCTIQASPGLYECQMAEGSKELLRLEPGEIESLNITLSAEDEGVYVVQVGFKYQIGNRSKIYSHPQNITIYFYDSNLRRYGVNI